MRRSAPIFHAVPAFIHDVHPVLDAEELPPIEVVPKGALTWIS